MQRIVYLSGLIPSGDLSDHLRSRLEVETVFLESAVPTVALRAAMVIGAGSTSFELLRRMTERVPLTPIPRWMRRTLQPVAVQDVFSLIVGALRGEPRNRHYDIGGPEQLTYSDLLRLFARTAGLKRHQVVVPWVGAGRRHARRLDRGNAARDSDPADRQPLARHGVPGAGCRARPARADV